MGYGQSDNHKIVGHVSLATDVMLFAFTAVETCLERHDFAGDTYREWLWDEAVASWAWLRGFHGIRLHVEIVYQAAGMDARDAVPEFRRRLDEINPRLMRRIDNAAESATCWRLPSPDTGVRVTPPDTRMKNKGETQ